MRTTMVTDLESACSYFENECEKYSIEMIARKEIPHGMNFKVRYNGTTAQANVYYGKKGLNIISQGSDNECLKLLKDKIAVS